MKLIKNISVFLNKTVWETDTEALSPIRAFLYTQVKVLLITFSEYKKDRCKEKASALTYFSLLSVVPVLAIAFGIAASFELREYLERELKKYFGGQDEVFRYANNFADEMLSNLKGGVISGVSAVLLIYAVGKLMNNIEGVFNDVWNTGQGRTLSRKITDYMAVIFLGPLLLILSSSVTVFLSGQVNEFIQNTELLSFLIPVVSFVLRLLPHTLIWMILFLFYLVFPHTTVKVKPALIAGVVAGVAFQVVQFFWIEGQAYLSSYGAVYGTLAALPLFMLWLNLSWTILLLGAEYAYSFQNLNKLTEVDADGSILSLHLKSKLALLALKEISKRFRDMDGAVSSKELIAAIRVREEHLKPVLSMLEEAQLINRVKGKEDSESYYQPALDIHALHVAMVLDRIQHVGQNEFPESIEIQRLEEVLVSLSEAMDKSAGNKKILDL